MSVYKNNFHGAMQKLDTFCSHLNYLHSFQFFLKREGESQFADNSVEIVPEGKK
jgi:hypothetical protein